MNNKILLDGSNLDLDLFQAIVYDNKTVDLTEESYKRIDECRAIVDAIVEKEEVRYGITTGFGKFSDVSIKKEDTRRLQEFIVLSHSVGVGDPLSIDIVRGMMLLKFHSFATGFSGIRPVIAHTLRDMLNNGVTPVVPEKGSVGASGDLAPLSHMALVMMGRGEAFYNGERMFGGDAMKKAGVNPVVFEEKEGLAVLNGTQTMTSLLASAMIKAENIMKNFEISGAVTIEALRGTAAAFDERVHMARPHKGQLNTALNYRNMLAGSKIAESHKECRKVQDAYSLRCIPQVHGAVKDTFNHVKSVLLIEMNSVTDNPLVFPDKQDVISGGNFHGEPLAFVADFMGIAISELANISERRIEYMLDATTSDGLPPFLTEEGGLNSGYMMAQVTAAALVSENKTLAHPSSVDSIPTSANKEDHVSMGTFACRKLHDILFNVKNVLSIEMLCAVQGLDLRHRLQNLESSAPVEAAFKAVRKDIPFMDCDRNIHQDICKMNDLVDSGEIVVAVEKEIGELVI